VALLRLLPLLPGLDLFLVVAHVNHGLRGELGDRDEQFVRRLAEEMGLPFEVERADMAAIASQRRLSLEEAGREVRYAFFRQLRLRHGARRIAVAHTADDQAETVLMRLLRGAGPAGAAGMESVTADGIVRPLLSCSRDEEVKFLHSLGQNWCEDETNDDRAFLRNRIRQGILPQLEEINPRVREALCQFSRLAADDEEFLAALADAEFDRVAVREFSRVRMETAHLLDLPRPLRYRVIRRALKEVRGNLRRLSLRHVEAVDALLAGEAPNASLDLPGVVAARSYGTLTFSTERLPAWEKGVPVPGEGEYLLPDGSLLTVTRDTGEQTPQAGERSSISVDPDAAPFPWEVRTFRPGDRLYLAGLGGHKKIKKLFMEEQIPLEERPRVPLLCCNAEILWVCGIRRSDSAPPLSSEESVVRVVYKKSPAGLQRA
jgi:tRNA(Ile)-lysidine synthase